MRCMDPLNETALNAMMIALQHALRPDAEHVCLSKMRFLNKKALREMRRPMIFEAEGTKPLSMQPLAVLIRYDVYLEMQKIMWGVK